VAPVIPSIVVLGVIVKVLVPSIIVMDGTMSPGPIVMRFVLSVMIPSPILLV
jgi:hypothetical protein